MPCGTPATAWTIRMREWLAQATLIGGFALTVVVWIIGYAVR